MAGLRSLLRPLNRQLRVHVEEVSLPRLDQLSGQIEDVRQATVDLRRLVTDDLDASNEAAALIGRSLQELQSAVTALQAQVAALEARLADRS
jgi:hypothetical protein